MQIIIKGLKGFKVYPETQDYIISKFQKFERMVKEPTILEFAVSHPHNSRQTLDKVVHLTVVTPGLAKSEHLEEIGVHFEESIDLLHKRFGKFLVRWKERQQDRRFDA